MAGRERRVPGRPDRDAAGPGPVPRGDRRRDRDVRRQVDHRPPASRGLPGRPHLGLDHDRAVGAAGPGRAGLGDGRRRVARGVRVRHLPRDRDRRHRRARLADLLRRRARLGAARPDRAGGPAVGHPVGGGPAARAGPGRHRRVRDHRAAGEGVPGVRRRAHPRLHPGRSGHDPAQGQGAAVHRQGRLPAAAGRAAVRGAVHADRGLARVGGRLAAVHAGRRADPVPGGRAPGRRQGPAVVRDQRGFGPVGGQAPADGLPARRRTRSRATRCWWSTWARRTRSRSRWPAPPRCSTLRMRGSGASGRGDSRLRQARPHRGRQDRGDPGRAGGRHPGVRVLDQPARGVRGRGGGADHRAPGRHGLGADPGPRGRDRAAPGRAGPGGAAARCCWRPTAGSSARSRPRPPSPPRSGPIRTTWCCWATRRPTPATTRSASGSRTSSAGRSPPGSRT